MKTINEYNKRLAGLNHKIFALTTETSTSYSLVTINPDAGFLAKLMGINIEDSIITSQDFKKVAREADNIISQYGSAYVGGK